MHTEWRVRMASLSILLCFGPGLISAAEPAPGARLSPDITARFLAGLAAPAADVSQSTGESVWALHARELDKAWKRTDQQVSTIQDWTTQFLAPAARQSETMFYM